MYYGKLSALPLGSITAEGFLREQLERSKNGMGGHLDEIEPGMIANPYINKTYVKRWGKGDQSGWGAELSGNYWTGLILLAFTLNDSELKAKAETWVNGVLTHRRPDGYLGTYYEPDAKIHEDFNAWGTACGMRALLYYYEATGRQEVFDAAYQCMLWFCDKWAGDHKTFYAGSFISVPMMYCYHKTGDKRLLDFCVDYQRFACAHDYTRMSYKSLLEDELIYNSEHTAGYGSLVYIPALIYSGNGNTEYLKASENGIRKVRSKAMNASGGPTGVVEYLAPVGSVAETEYCSFTYYNAAYSVLSAITGEAKFGDYAEQLVYNGAQGARKKDERVIAYLSAPNQVYATDISSNDSVDMQVYSPCYPVACCPANSVILMPDFIRGMALTDDTGALYLTAYGPCTIKHNNMTAQVKTLYPFRNEISIDMTGNGVLYCKNPVWSKGTTVTVDGKPYSAAADQNGFIRLDLTGAEHHHIELSFKAEIEVLHIDDSDGSGKHPLAFRYGALLFSLPIQEKWEPYYPETETPLEKDWPWFKVKPVFEEAPTDDAYLRLQLRRDRIYWNVAVDENLKAEDIQVEYTDTNGYVWSEPQVIMKIPAYKTPYSCCLYPSKTFEPFGDRQKVTHSLELTLVPYGCTNLRITYFPRADLEKKL